VPVTVQLATNPGGGTLRGTATVNTNPATGIATFAGLTLDRAGNGYQLVASSPGLTWLRPVSQPERATRRLLRRSSA